jgi:hypothetical protein
MPPPKWFKRVRTKPRIRNRCPRAQRTGAPSASRQHASNAVLCIGLRWAVLRLTKQAAILGCVDKPIDARIAN